MHNQNQQQWRTLKNNIVSQLTCPVLIENGKYILFIGEYNDKHSTVMYDVQNNTYPQYFRSPRSKNTELYASAMTFDFKEKLIYVWGGDYHSCFMIYDLNKNEWDFKVIKTIAKELKEKYNVSHVGEYSRIICDGQQRLHVIGGTKNNTHMTFNANKQIFEQQYIFKEYEYIHGFGLVFDPIYNRLILFGGRRSVYMNSLSDVLFFNLLTSRWSMCKDIEWKIGSLHNFGFVFLSGMQIILVFGGAESIQYSDAIWMIDLNDKSRIEITHIKCPLKSSFHALLVPNTNNSQTNIHLFDINSQKHWCIGLKSILPSKYLVQPLALCSNLFPVLILSLIVNMK